LIVDVHCHLYEYSRDYIEKLFSKMRDLVVVAVSDDYESSLRTLDLARRYKRVIPCLGLHPWEVGRVKDPIEEARRIVELAERENAPCLGEIGLDTKFVAETINAQREVFRFFLSYAKSSRPILLNVHAAGTWEEVLNYLSGMSSAIALIHWYTGPLHLLTRIRDSGFYISINPAVKIQHKHREVVRYAPLDILLTESDGPYDYRGLKLSPELIPEVLSVAAEIKGIDREALSEAVAGNFQRILKTLEIDLDVT
jgi:TatD DNase family protein